MMTLFELLQKIEGNECLPLVAEKNERIKGWSIDSRPQSVFNVTISFMCEEETWVTCSTYNEILIPWYNCEVHGFNPLSENTIQVWLKDEEYIRENFRDCVHWKEKKND